MKDFIPALDTTATSDEEMIKQLQKELLTNRLASLKKTHDSDGWFAKAPRHQWIVYYPKIMWDETLDMYLTTRKCEVCGLKEPYVYGAIY